MDTFHAQIPFTLREADFPGLGQLYRGKVRDNYSKDDRIVMITTDRLSAFDRVLTTVPFKGELLNRLTVFWFEKTKDVAPNHILDLPDPSVLVVRRLKPLAVEMVVRGYLTGSLWRDYQAGKGAKAYGVELPESMRKDQKLEKPILTPSTKEQLGKHDEPISPRELVARGTITQKQWDEMARMTLDLFAAGQGWAKQRGLILDKEFFRQWLIRERNYKGEGPLPEIPDEVRAQLAGKYVELVRTLTGAAPKLQVGDTRARIEKALRTRKYLQGQ